MIENLKNLKKSFSNGPKAKIIGGMIIAAIIISTVLIINLRKTVIISIDGKERKFVTYKGTVKEALDDKGIEVLEKDKIEPSLDTEVTENQKIEIRRAVPIKVVMAGQEQKELLTAEETVEDMLQAEKDELKKSGIDYKEQDIVEPDLSSKIEDGMEVKITDVEVEKVVEVQEIKYSTEIVQDNTRYSIQPEVVQQEGINGEQEVTYEVVKHDGVEVEREQIAAKVIKEAQNEIIAMGTMDGVVNRGGDIYGKKKFIASATAYSASSSSDRTYSGRALKRDPNGISTIAVDPTVVPLGSKVWVEDYGYAVAADIGGAVKGNVIDLYFDTHQECVNWGRRNKEIVVIAYPGEW